MSTILIDSVYSGWAPELSSIRIYWLCLPASWGFPSGSVGKESAYNAGDLGSIPGSGRSPGEGNGNPLQYSCLENSMDRGSGWLQFMGLQSQTGLSDFQFFMEGIFVTFMDQRSVVTEVSNVFWVVSFKVFFIMILKKSVLVGIN